MTATPDLLDAPTLRAAVAALDRRARAISPQAFVTLTAWPHKWQLNVWHVGRMQRDFEGPAPAALLAQAEALLAEHDPAAAARTLGLELAGPCEIPGTRQG